MQHIENNKPNDISPTVTNVKNKELNMDVHIEFVILVKSSPINLQFNPANKPSLESVIEFVEFYKFAFIVSNRGFKSEFI